MWGYDGARSGAAPAALELPETLHLLWVRELPPPRRAWPKQWDDDRVVVAGGRSLPGMFNRSDGTLLHSDVVAKPHGGYRVQIEGE